MNKDEKSKVSKLECNDSSLVVDKANLRVQYGIKTLYNETVGVYQRKRETKLDALALRARDV